MAWIQPLDLETWLVSVFSGTKEIFGIVAIIAIAGLATYFRMTNLMLGYMVGMFILLFSGYIDISFILIFGTIGGMLLGYWLSKLFK